MAEGKDTSGKSQGKLAGKVCVVTGASGGIGLAIARALFAEGASVALGARRLNLLEEECARLNAASQAEGKSTRAIGVKTDVTVRSSVEALVAAAKEAFGGEIDILVNNAGVMYFTLMKNCKVDEWDKTVDVNCKGVLHGFGAVLPGMLKSKKGHIITISSDAGRRVFPKAYRFHARTPA